MIKMYGAPWCGDCVRAKFIFEKFGIEYEYIDVDESEEASNYVIQINGGNRSIPVIEFGDGTHMTEPSNEALVQKLKELGVIVS